MLYAFSTDVESCLSLLLCSFMVLCYCSVCVCGCVCLLLFPQASNFNATSHINVSGPQKNFADILEMMSWTGDTVQNKLSNNSWINDLCRIRGGMKIDSRTSGSVWCVHRCRLEDLSLQGSSNHSLNRNMYTRTG